MKDNPADVRRFDMHWSEHTSALDILSAITATIR